MSVCAAPNAGACEGPLPRDQPRARFDAVFEARAFAAVFFVAVFFVAVFFVAERAARADDARAHALQCAPCVNPASTLRSAASRAGCRAASFRPGGSR